MAIVPSDQAESRRPRRRLRQFVRREPATAAAPGRRRDGRRRQIARGRGAMTEIGRPRTLLVLLVVAALAAPASRAEIARAPLGAASGSDLIAVQGNDRRIHVEALPRLYHGKVDKKQLAQLAHKAAAARAAR